MMQLGFKNHTKIYKNSMFYLPVLFSDICFHTFKIKTNNLTFQVELETTLLPIGYLRVGLYLERALLFKVLADKVGLPSCLVRGQYGRSWVEVALPNIPPPPRPVYPSKLLRPNFIVDLIHNPGMLIPLKSNEAYQYCKS